MILTWNMGLELIMMMICFCGMVDRRKAFGLISSRDRCQRSSPLRISETPRSGFIEWSCAIVITTTPRRQEQHDNVKKIDNNVMSNNCDVIVIFLIYCQFGAIRKPDSGKMVCKTYIFNNSNLLHYKSWKQN